MAERGNERHYISRRAALTGTAIALGAATAATLAHRAAAQQKISQALAKYQLTPNNEYHCDVCANFQPPNSCKFVQGEINPKGWCQLFTPKT